MEALATVDLPVAEFSLGDRLEGRLELGVHPGIPGLQALDAAAQAGLVVPGIQREAARPERLEVRLLRVADVLAQVAERRVAGQAEPEVVVAQRRPAAACAARS